MKNKYQILPFAFITILFLVGFNALISSVPLVTEGSRTSSIGAISKDEGMEDSIELNLCGLESVVCQNEIDSPPPQNYFITGTSQIEAQIREIAKRENFKWPDYLVRLAYYESRFNPKAVNVNKNKTVDRGLFQWNRYYHPEITDTCAYDVECSTIATMNAINAGKQKEWSTNYLAMRK